MLLDGEQPAFLQELIIPLPLRATLSGRRAHNNALELVSRYRADRAGAVLTFNTFLMPSNAYKTWWSVRRGRPADVACALRQQPLPKWVWLTEYGNSQAWQQGQDAVLGHILQDCSGRGLGVLEDDLIAFLAEDTIAVSLRDGSFQTAQRSTLDNPMPRIDLDEDCL
jgi:hypothetical protein